MRPTTFFSKIRLGCVKQNAELFIPAAIQRLAAHRAKCEFKARPLLVKKVGKSFLLVCERTEYAVRV